jgi:hypothetical protein
MDYSFRFEKQRIGYYVKFGLCFMLAIWIWGYIFLIRSNEYKLAVDYLKSNQIVKDNLGVVTSSRPGFGNTSLRYSSHLSRSEFSVVLYSERNTGTAYMELDGDENGWVVTSAQLNLDGKLIDLKQNSSGD